MPQKGNQLGYELQSYAGLYTNLIQTDIPLNWIVNTNLLGVNGDTVEFDYFIVPEQDFFAQDDFPNGDGDCAGADKECLGTNKIRHTLNKRYDKLYPMKQCRISNMSATSDLNGQTVQGLVNSMVGSIEENYARGLSKYLVKSLVTTYSSITEFTPSVEAINILDRIEESVVDIENLHEIERSSQTVIVNYSVSSELRKLNYECCELTTALVPENQNKIGVERMIKVPDAWLIDDITDPQNPVQYEFVNYQRALYTYHENCVISRTVELTNELDGYLGYHKSAVWGAFLDESVEQIPETQGVAGHKVREQITLATGSISSDGAETATSISGTYDYTENDELVANASIVILEGVNVIETISSLTAGTGQAWVSSTTLTASTTYTVELRQGSRVIDSVEITTTA